MNSAQLRLHAAALKIFAETGSRSIKISALAKEAQVVRGTVYNNVPDLDQLFSQVAGEVAREMDARIQKRLEGVTDPAERFSISLRAPLQRMADDPTWGRFIVRFAMIDNDLRGFWLGTPRHSILEGIESGRFDLDSESLKTFIMQAGGATFATMELVADGQVTWREAGFDLARWQLRILGLSKKDAAKIAEKSLPTVD